MKEELKKFGIWLGKNNFARNSYGIWSTNCLDFKRMTDDEIINMYINNPNELKEFIKNTESALVNER